MGCFRTLQEIGAWPHLSCQEQQALLGRLDQRRAELGSFKVRRLPRRR